MMYELQKQEKNRLIKAVNAVLSIPFIDDLEDYIWEAVFCYMKGLPLVDPLTSIRSKQLFDVVDDKNKIGWSAKALQWTIGPEIEFELVIQRADIVKKGKSLGFKNLTRNSSPEVLGEALLRHWFIEKVNKDAEHQGVNDKRVCVLLKSKDRKKFAYFEETLREYKPLELTWHWTDKTKTGLQGKRKSDDFCVFRWYPNQTQLFERFVLPQDTFIFKLEPRRLGVKETVELLSGRLDKN